MGKGCYLNCFLKEFFLNFFLTLQNYVNADLDKTEMLMTSNEFKTKIEYYQEL